MSFPTRCYGCVMGNHTKHELHPNGVVPGLIGGTHCDCEGECVEQYQAEVRQLTEQLKSLKEGNA